MNVEASYSGNIAVASVSGRVDSANAKDFDKALRDIIDRGVTGLVVDCNDLRYMSSAGLRVLLIAIRKTNAAGGGLAMCRVPDHIREVLEVSGFVRLTSIHDSAEAASASFSS